MRTSRPPVAMSRASSEEDSTNKRRKIFRACDQCVHAKTRCEDVSGQGCSLCRRRRKTCSLAGAVSRGDEHEDGWDRPPVDRVREMSNLRFGEEARVAVDPQLERRLEAIEEQLRLNQHNGGSGTATPLHRNSAHSVDSQSFQSWFDKSLDASKAGIPLADLRYRPSVPYSDELFSLHPATNAYPCVLERGIYNADQVDMAFHSFKHAIVKTCPLSPWLSSSTPTPTHPFVILAMLQHLPLFASARLAGMVEESVLVVLGGGSACIEAVLALFILSLAPAIPFDTDDAIHNRASPLRLITLAFNLGKDMGLHWEMRRMARNRDLDGAHWHEGLLQLELWTAVVNRYNLLQTLFSYPDSLVPFIRYELDGGASVHATCLRHLQDEQTLVAKAFDVLEKQLAIELEVHNDTRVDQLNQEWETNLTSLRALRFHGPTSDSLMADKASIEMTLMLRSTNYTFNVPYPLIRLREILSTPMSHVIPTSLAALRHLMPDHLNPPSRLAYPLHVVYSGSIACMMLLAAANIIRTMHRPSSMDIIDPPRLKALYRLIKSSGAVMKTILSRIEDVYGNVEDVDKHPVEPAPREQGMQLTHSQLPLNTVDPINDPLGLFDFNMIGWDFLLPQWTPGEHHFDPVLGQGQGGDGQGHVHGGFTG